MGNFRSGDRKSLRPLRFHIQLPCKDKSIQRSTCRIANTNPLCQSEEEATVKRSKPTSFLASSNSYDDEDISFIQNQPNYNHCEIAESFIASSQRQFDEPVESIAKEYRVEDAECSISQQHSISSCSVIPHPILRQKTVVWHYKTICAV